MVDASDAVWLPTDGLNDLQYATVLFFILTTTDCHIVLDNME